MKLRRVVTDSVCWSRCANAASASRAFAHPTRPPEAGIGDRRAALPRFCSRPAGLGLQCARVGADTCAHDGAEARSGHNGARPRRKCE